MESFVQTKAHHLPKIKGNIYMDIFVHEAKLQ